MSSQYLEYWYMALAHQRGLKLRTSVPDRLMQRLYAARRGAMDSDLDKLSIVRPMPDQLWIVSRETQPDPDPKTHPEPIQR
jgi:hypothetical protein